MKKMILLIVLAVLAILAFNYLEVKENANFLDEKTALDLLNTNAYKIGEKPTEYQFRAKGQIYRYWRLSDIAALNVRTLSKYKGSALSKRPSFSLNLSSQQLDTASAYLMGNFGLDLDPCILDDLVDNCDCDASNSSTGNNEDETTDEERENCLGGDTGGEAGECQENTIWDGLAICGVINDLPWKYEINPKLVFKGQTYNATRLNKGTLFTFPTACLNLSNGFGSIKVNIFESPDLGGINPDPTVTDVIGGQKFATAVLPFALK